MLNTFNFGEIVDGYKVRVLNEREIRAGSGILFLVALLSFINCIITENILLTQIFVGTFMMEFIIRVLINPKYAPSLIIGRFMVNNQMPEYVGAEQKRFAWSLGLMLSILIFVLTTVFPSSVPIGEDSLQNAVIGLSCITCITLLYFESVFGICLGCKLYNIFNKSELNNCAGGTCMKSNREECQKISMLQMNVLIIFFISIVIIIVFFTDLY